VSRLNRDAVEVALRNLLAHLDYDLHKSIERSEDTGENTYPEVVDDFISVYEEEMCDPS
jgi:hypothetical protein